MLLWCHVVWRVRNIVWQTPHFGTKRRCHLVFCLLRVVAWAAGLWLCCRWARQLGSAAALVLLWAVLQLWPKIAWVYGWAALPVGFYDVGNVDQPPSWQARLDAPLCAGEFSLQHEALGSKDLFGPGWSNWVSCAPNLLNGAAHRFKQSYIGFSLWPSKATQVIYMDDRSWSANSPGILMGTLQSWYDFSTRLGLKENLPKTQITYASEQYQQELLQFMGNSPFRPYVRSSVCILGACATGVPRTDLHDKEQQRLDDALQTLDRIRLLPLDHQTILHTARTTAVAKAAFGWVANSPQTQHVTKFNTSLRHCGQYFQGGSAYLHNLLLGATTQLDIVVGLRQTLLWGKRFVADMVPWLQS